MNINQAKSVAGIPKSQRIEGRAGIERAERVIMAKITAARKTGDDTRAAELSEAREVFRARLIGHGRCQVCGATINKAATHCALHLRQSIRPKALPLAGHEHEIAPRPKRQNPNARAVGAPEGGMLAELGFYARPVQQVVSRWLGKGAYLHQIEACFRPVAEAMLFRENHADITVAAYTHWPMVWELGQALDRVLNDKARPEAWLLSQNVHIMIDGAALSWHQIADEIARQGGKRFTPASLAMSADRLRISTPKSRAAECREAMNRPS